MKKLACRPSNDPLASACERCFRSGRPCVPHLRKPYAERRSMKKQDTCPAFSPDSVEGTLSATPPALSNQQYNVTSQSHQGGSESFDTFDRTDAVSHPEQQSPDSISYTSEGSTCGDLLRCQLKIQLDETTALLSELTWPMVEHALLKYRNMTSVWPFVVLDDKVTTGDLIQDKPMIMAAILVVTFAHNIPFQDTFAVIFRQALSRKVIVEAVQSLELVHAMLIYMAWLVNNISR
jgi:hypothetical protein